jgi:hypothetical protein
VSHTWKISKNSEKVEKQNILTRRPVESEKSGLRAWWGGMCLESQLEAEREGHLSSGLPG